MEQVKMPDSLVNNLLEFCENRSNVYAFLARCFEKEIDKNFADRVVESFSFSSDDATLNEEVIKLKEGLAHLDDNGVEHLAVVFNRVFFGMGPRTAQKAFPYESVYTSSGGLMMQKAYEQVRELYRSEGFIKNPSFSEPDDHLAIELAFMKTLCDRTLTVLSSAEEEKVTEILELQRSFLRDHLLNWISLFVSDMQGSAEDGFYYHLASFTKAFLNDDYQAISEVLD